MKLQGVGIIFALIVLPLILVLTYYIQLQVDTVEMQKEYDRKLLDSTYGAMSAFEINTANEDLSTVSDSLRTIIEASTNVFMSTLATNLGMSNASSSNLEMYIPSILYTLYDGYYISAPTKMPIVLTDSDGNAVSLGEIGVTKSGEYFEYKEIHTTLDSQKNCTDCNHEDFVDGTYKCASGSENHIIYDDGNDNNNSADGNEYKYMSQDRKKEWQITYDDLSDSDKEAYGQLLYLKKNELNVYTININDAEQEIDNILKTYMPYSARYKRGEKGDTNYFDLNVIYTLDNYVTIEGTIGNIYYSKSGYLIPKNTVQVVPSELLNYSQEDAKKFIEDGNSVKIIIDDNTDPSNRIEIVSGGSGSADQIKENIKIKETEYDKINSYVLMVNNIKNNLIKETNSLDYDNLETEAKNIINEIYNELGTKLSLTIDYSKTTVEQLDYLYNELSNGRKNKQNELNDLQYQLNQISSITYYVTAQIFSEWVENNLNNVMESDLIEISGQSYSLIKGEEKVIKNFGDSSVKVFDITGNENTDNTKLTSITEIPTDSPYTMHKLDVIRNSIQYNLNLAMTTYNNMLISNKDYAMPVMEDEEWDKILNNVSIVSFMQGYNCGLKTYNNYKIVSSTNNEISISPNEIYYVEKNSFSNEETEYHRIDCPKLYEKEKEGTKEYISFVSKEVKYDKIYNKSNSQIPYEYDHKNYACYECINDGNYKGVNIFDVDDSNYNKEYSKNLRKAFYIGIGKARNNLYKMNAVANSEGYEIIYDNNQEDMKDLSKDSTLNVSDVKSIEIVLDTVKTHDSGENVLNYKVKMKDVEYLSDTTYTIVPNITTYTTLKIDLKPGLEFEKKISIDELIFENLNKNSTAYSSVDGGNEKYQEEKYQSEEGIAEKNSMIFKDSIRFLKVIYK